MSGSTSPSIAITHSSRSRNRSRIDQQQHPRSHLQNAGQERPNLLAMVWTKQLFEVNYDLAAAGGSRRKSKVLNQ